MIKRVKTGIMGLDEMIEGGFPRGKTILVSGGPGTGKSIFSLQFLYYGALQWDEPGVFISFEERPADIIANSSRFGWNLEYLIKKDKLRILSVIPTRMEEGRYVIDSQYTGDAFFPRDFSIDTVSDIISKRFEEINAERVVIDTTSALVFQLRGEANIRQELLGFYETVTKSGCTSILTSESGVGSEKFSSFDVEEFLASGVIILNYIKTGNERRRALEILKMRGTNHYEGIY
ncbi:MAG: ATPase domain-containing protein, partial [Candidatus Hydrothermarchaeota archaeon]